MKINRRSLFGIAAASAIVPAFAAIVKPRRVSQDELDEALISNWRWYWRRPNGWRPNFAGCDLSGLEIRSEIEGEQLLILGLDFTEANLSETHGNEISFTDCLMRRALFDGSMYPQLAVFKNCNLREALVRKALWGTGSINGHPLHTIFDGSCLDRADFSGSRIRGHFEKCSMNKIELRDSDLSGSKYI